MLEKLRGDLYDGWSVLGSRREGLILLRLGGHGGIFWILFQVSGNSWEGLGMGVMLSDSHND